MLQQLKFQAVNPMTGLSPDAVAAIAAECDRLRYIESIWRNAVDSADQGIWDYNCLTGERFYSDGWKNIRGLPAEGSGYPNFDYWISRIHPDDKDHVLHNVAKHNSGEEKEWEFAYRELRQDGKWIWVLSRGKSVAFDANGVPTRLLGSDIDITKVKEAEEDARLQRQRDHDEHVRELEGARHDADEARQIAVQVSESDQLTGIRNRRFFISALENAMAADRNNLALLLLDLDKFKFINDNFGHLAGDDVLQEAAVRLIAVAGEGATVARLGGDEFGIIVHAEHEGHGSQACQLVGRIKAALTQPVRWRDWDLRIGVSIGVAFAGEHGVTPKELLVAADLALYQAKAAGRGGCVIYSADLGREAEAEAAMERELRDDIVKGAIEVHYQPIVDATQGKPVLVEALVRWRSASLGSVPPDRFLPHVEKLGLLPTMTKHVLQTACAAAKHWSQEICVTVNLAASEVCEPSTPLHIMRALQSTGLSPSRLVVEVTEQALVRDVEVAREVIGAIRKLGVRVFLDDFGAGYSGLCYLRDLAFDGLKLDRAFAFSCVTNPASRTILRHTGELARELGLFTVVEGIESEDALAVVRSLGFSVCQGFHFAKPMPAEAFAASQAPFMATGRAVA